LYSHFRPDVLRTRANGRRNYDGKGQNERSTEHDRILSCSALTGKLGFSCKNRGFRVMWAQCNRGGKTMAVHMEKSDFQKSRAFSPGVITQGGKIVWLAGQTATRDEAGNDISGNFEAQVRTIFSLIDKTLKKAGGSLANMVTMTVFINDPRLGDRFIEMRAGFFPEGNFPASALISVSHFARPGMLIEIQGVAVIGG